MSVTDMKDFRIRKVEQQYFEFYKHLEQFFGEKPPILAVSLAWSAIRFLRSIS